MNLCCLSLLILTSACLKPVLPADAANGTSHRADPLSLGRRGPFGPGRKSPPPTGNARGLIRLNEPPEGGAFWNYDAQQGSLQCPMCTKLWTFPSRRFQTRALCAIVEIEAVDSAMKFELTEATALRICTDLDDFSLKSRTRNGAAHPVTRAPTCRCRPSGSGRLCL